MGEERERERQREGQTRTIPLFCYTTTIGRHRLVLWAGPQWAFLMNSEMGP